MSSSGKYKPWKQIDCIISGIKTMNDEKLYRIIQRVYPNVSLNQFIIQDIFVSSLLDTFNYNKIIITFIKICTEGIAYINAFLSIASKYNLDVVNEHINYVEFNCEHAFNF